MRVRAQHAARMLAAGRVVFGVLLVTSPRHAARWIGQAAEAPGTQVAIRALGARDAALGLGTLASAVNASHLQLWLVASSVCDAADFAATLAGPRTAGRPAVLALAATATLTGLGAAAAL